MNTAVTANDAAMNQSTAATERDIIGSRVTLRRYVIGFNEITTEAFLNCDGIQIIGEIKNRTCRREPTT